MRCCLHESFLLVRAHVFRETLVESDYDVNPGSERCVVEPDPIRCEEQQTAEVLHLPQKSYQGVIEYDVLS